MFFGTPASLSKIKSIHIRVTGHFQFLKLHNRLIMVTSCLPLAGTQQISVPWKTNFLWHYGQNNVILYRQHKRKTENQSIFVFVFLGPSHQIYEHSCDVVYRECELKRFHLLISAAPSGGVLFSHEQGSDSRVMPIEPLRLGRTKFHHIRPETSRRDVITKSCVNLELSSDAKSHSPGQEIHLL
jgi:hypothetical protein